MRKLFALWEICYWQSFSWWWNLPPNVIIFVEHFHHYLCKCGHITQSCYSSLYKFALLAACNRSFRKVFYGAVLFIYRYLIPDYSFIHSHKLCICSLCNLTTLKITQRTKGIIMSINPSHYKVRNLA